MYRYSFICVRNYKRVYVLHLVRYLFSFNLAGVESLLSGIPLARANLNNFRANYSSILETSSNFDGVCTVCVCAR